MIDHWSPLIFLGYNGSAPTHGPKIIGPIIWNLDSGCSRDGMMKRTVLDTDIIETMLNSYRNWYDKQPMSVEMKITF